MSMEGLIQVNLVSIIIPVYNAEHFLKRCVESALNQDYKSLEVILINDGSTDGSAALCDYFASKDCRVKVIHQDNLGVSAARNAGLNIANGEYVFFVDADDYILPEHVSLLVSLLEDYDAQIATATGRMSDYGDCTNKKDNTFTVTMERAVEMLLCYRIPVQVWGKAYRRTLLIENKLFFPEDISIGEDFIFNCQAFQNAKTVVMTQICTYFQCKTNPNSATTRFDPLKWQSGLHAMDVIRKSLNFSSHRIKAAWRYANWRTYSDAYDLIVLSHSETICPNMYAQCLHVTKYDALHALSVPVSLQDKLRALVMRICPKVIPWAMIQRRRLKKIEVDTQS